MSKAKATDVEPRKRCWLLRRHDQQFLAALSVIAGLFLASLWWQSGGDSGRLVEWGASPTRIVRFEVNVNEASWPELTQLPEIGETLGRRIVEDRRVEGPFRSPEDLLRVRGIGEKKLDQMRPYLSPQSWLQDPSCNLAPENSRTRGG